MVRSGGRGFAAGLLLFGLLTLVWPTSQTFDTIVSTGVHRVGPAVDATDSSISQPVVMRRNLRCLPPYLGAISKEDPAVTRGDLSHWSSCTTRNRRRGLVGSAFALSGLTLVLALRPRW